MAPKINNKVNIIKIGMREKSVQQILKQNNYCKQVKIFKPFLIKKYRKRLLKIEQRSMPSAEALIKFSISHLSVSSSSGLVSCADSHLVIHSVLVQFLFFPNNFYSSVTKDNLNHKLLELNFEQKTSF